MSPAEENPSPDIEPEQRERGSFLAELKKRQVFQAAGAYAVIAWGATEILDGVISRFGWPDWIATLVVILFVVGFPVAMFLAWVFDWTPDGIRRDEPWSAMGWVSIAAATIFLVAGSGALFWLINPSGVVRLEQTGVAVLPCRYQGEPEYAFRAEGIAGVISGRLAGIRQLQVLEYASIVTLAARNLPTQELAGLAGVEWLVECRLAREADRWRIEASLVYAATDESEPVVSLEVELQEIPASLESVSLSLLGKLGLPAAGNGGQPWNTRLAGHIPSFDGYLRGEQAMRLGTAESFRAARDYFLDAQNVPGFELARQREADALIRLLESEPPKAEREIRATLRAVSLMLDMVEKNDPSLAELYAARMRLAILSAKLGVGPEPEIDQFRTWFERAVELRPSYAEPYRLLAAALIEAGERDAAHGLLQIAQKLDLAPG